MRGLTDKQRDILDFIEDFTLTEGMAPTVYEIAEHYDIKTSTVFAHLKSLQKKGFLQRSSKARSISLTQPRRGVRHVSFVLPVPLLGRISAGLPLDSPALREGEVYCDMNLLGNVRARELFALKIDGESMKDAGILDGDTVIVHQTSDLRPGDIVVALVEDETTVKKFYPRKGNIELHPANPEFKIQQYKPEQVSVQGKVLALQRSF